MLSGNRNFEARVHQNIKANLLMSPSAVAVFALAGRVDISLATDPIGKRHERRRLPEYLAAQAEVGAVLNPGDGRGNLSAFLFHFTSENPWNEIGQRRRCL